MNKKQLAPLRLSTPLVYNPYWYLKLKWFQEPPAEEPVNSIAISIETTDHDSDSMSDFDEDNLKIEESSDWTRNEDRLILQVLQEHLTREERKGSFENNKSIIELLEEKNVYVMLYDSLTDRSVNQIKERVLYLLTMLVISERDT